MLTITNKGQSEALSHYTGYEVVEEVSGELTLSLTSLAVGGNAGHELVKEEAVITIEDGREFRIKQLKESRGMKQIDAISTFFDLTGVIKDEMFAGTKTFHDFIKWVFAGTGWSYDIEGIPLTTKLVPNFGNANVVKLSEILLSMWEGERQILPGNRVLFSELLGPDNDAQYRYGHNVRALSHSVDTTKLHTSITARGGGTLKVKYTSPNAGVFPHAGEAEPFTDERFTIGPNLLEEARKRLVDYPEVAIELDAMELTEKALGERVWLIYEPLGIEFQTRILLKKTREPKERSSAIIGNVIPKSQNDQLVEQKIEIDDNAKQSYSKFEQTNEKIMLEVGHVRTYTDEELGKVKETATANFTVLAGQITSKADATFVDALGTRVNTVEFDMNAIEGVISQKVSHTDYNGDTIASLINQTATTIDIQASKINLVGAVTVLSELSGDLGNITAGTIIGTTIRLDNGGLLDLRAGTILWGHNVPQADWAVVAQTARSLNGFVQGDFSLQGHTHASTEYVKPYTGQSIYLWRSGNRVRVYQGGNSYVELTGVSGSD